MCTNDPFISYIRARDPSILTWNRGCLNNVRVRLDEKMGNDTSDEIIEDVSI